jgi:hypothetical protein
MTIHSQPPEGGRIVDEPMGEALSRRYLAYALSTITNRALPDVRDGFKPVHRRILYAMHQMRLNPQAAARKCAKVVGEVMGGYHPHGDASIYDALVRLAQDFAQRLIAECGSDIEKQVQRAWKLCYSREASMADAQAAVEFVKAQTEHYRANPAKLEHVVAPAEKNNAPAELLGLAALCHALMSGNAFLYVD